MIRATRTHAPTDLPVPLLIATLGLVAGLTAQDATARDAEGDTHHWRRATDLLAESAPTRAVFHLRRHLEQQPGDVEARSLLARTYTDVGLTQAALQEVHLVLSEQPGDATALLTLARLQQRSARPSEALATLERMPSDAAFDDRATELRARLLHEAGRHDEAAPALGDLVRQRPDDSGLHNLLGLSLLRLGDPSSLDQAVTAFQRACELDDSSAALRNNLGFALEKTGRLQEALVAYIDAEGLNGDTRYTSSRLRVERALNR